VTAHANNDATPLLCNSVSMVEGLLSLLALLLPQSQDPFPLTLYCHCDACYLACCLEPLPTNAIGDVADWPCHCCCVPIAVAVAIAISITAG